MNWPYQTVHSVGSEGEPLIRSPMHPATAGPPRRPKPRSDFCRRWLIAAILVGLSTLHGPSAADAEVHRVNARARGANDGTTWRDAFKSLQTALARSQAGDEIWVAAGTYVPAGEQRSSTFQMQAGVAVYGGFVGTETERRQRDAQANVTILSGDVNGDDRGFRGNVENVYQVVRGADGATLDGFTIRGGRASRRKFDTGAGVFVPAGSMVIKHCVFQFNNATLGGAIGLIRSSSIVSNCIFRSNRAGSGGAVHALDGAPSILNCRFESNEASVGGAISLRGGAPLIVNSLFVANQAKPFYSNFGIAGGGGIWNDFSAGRVVHCVFTQNTNGAIGNFLLERRRKEAARGALFSIRQSVLWGDIGGESEPPFAEVHSSIVQGSGGSGPGWTGWGGSDGGSNLDVDPHFVDPPSNLRLPRYSAGVDAGDVSALPADLADLDDDGDREEPLPIDLDGNPRVQGAAPDMGPYESTPLTGEVPADRAGLYGVAMILLLGVLSVRHRSRASGHHRGLR